MSEDTVDTEILENALAEHRNLPIDAAHYLPETADALFLEYGRQVQDLNTTAWQVVFGGPGSGKTHLLRVYQERSLNGAVAQRPSKILESLPIYLDASSFASRLYTDDDERRAQASFRAFIDVFSNRLDEAVKALHSSEGFYRRLRDLTRARKAQETLEQIRSELDHQKLRYPFVQESVERTSERERRSESELGGGARLGLPHAADGTSLHLQAHSGGSRRESEGERHRASGSTEPQWHVIRSLIVELCKQIQVGRLDILIDNWPALDGDGTTSVQPHFGQLLKKAFSGEQGRHAISVKIAADGLATRLWDRDGSVGLRREVDIISLVNLNEPLLDDRELIRFFEALLFERLMVSDGRVGYLLDPEVPSQPISPDFVHTLFGERETFELLVRGAEGRIGLFLRYIAEMTRDTRANLDEPWSRERVLKAVRGRQTREIAEYGYLSRAAHILVTRIKPAVAERDHPVFAISSAEHEEYRSVLRELIFKELLQPDVPAEYRRQATSELLAFAVSEELMREWHRAVSINQELQVILGGDSVEEPPEPTLRELRIYLNSGRPE